MTRLGGALSLSLLGTDQRERESWKNIKKNYPLIIGRGGGFCESKIVLLSSKIPQSRISTVTCIVKPLILN